MCSSLVLLLSKPSDNGGLLQSLSVRKGHMPRQSGVKLVHLVKVDSGSLLVVHIQRHLSRQEEDTRHGRGDGALQSGDGEGGNLLGRGGGSLESVLDHVGLEDGSFEVDVVVGEGLELGSEDLFRGGCDDEKQGKIDFGLEYEMFSSAYVQLQLTQL